jgi:hypothetical protein
MAIDTIDTTSLTTRRALLGAGMGAIAATVASALGRPLATKADNNDPLTLGVGTNTATDTTSLHQNTSNKDGLYVAAAGSSSKAIVGEDFLGVGVKGSTTSGAGVHGLSTGRGAGVRADSDSGDGVNSRSQTGWAVYGFNYASDKAAIEGGALAGSTGVLGFSGPLEPGASASTGVYGSAAAVGVRGDSSEGRGGVFKGNAAQVKLVASTRDTHPTSGQKGDLFVDKHGRLWFCKGGSTWHQLA